jgi:serine/threonine-protein kinase RsbW
VITLKVPGSIEYRDIAVRVVGGACKLIDARDPDQFATEVVSAFSEAFNNVILHGYKGVPPGDIEITISHSAEGVVPVELRLAMKDTGRVFDPGQYLELPEEMPERGMGLFIIRSFVDELLYQPGPPNVLTLIKRTQPGTGRKRSAPP